MNLIRWLAIGILAAKAASGQSVLTDAKKIADARNLLDTFQGNELPCEVAPIKPHFIFSLRLQAGYVARVPLAQSENRAQSWIVLARLQPKETGGSPVYLSDVAGIPAAGDRGRATLDGFYWLGDGRYSVKFLAFDGRGDVCRKEWEIDATLKSGVSGFKPLLAPGTVAGISAAGASGLPEGKPLDRLTVLLHAASVQQLQTLLSPLDQTMLLDGLTALMEELPARSVRLVVFNLEQQREIFRKDGFRLDALPEVAHALNSLQPAAVSYSAVQHPGAAPDFVEDLVSREMHAAEPSGELVFLGPRSIYKSKPSSSFGSPPGAKQQFFYLVCEPTGILRPPSRGASNWSAEGMEMGLPPAGPLGVPPPIYPGETAQSYPQSGRWSNYGPNNGPDSIEYAVDRLKGKTIKVDSAESFADAVSKIARASLAK